MACFAERCLGAVASGGAVRQTRGPEFPTGGCICEATVLKNIILAFSVSCDGSELVRPEEDAVGKRVRGTPQMIGSVQVLAQEVGLDHKTQRADRS